MSSAEEREHKRRISHSAMERRRRERTNDIINELKDLIPWLRNEAKLQKLEVLEQCANYIKELQQQTKGRQSLSEVQQSSYERQQSPSEVQQSSYEGQQSSYERQQTAARKRQREAGQYGGSSAGDDSPLLDDDEGDVLPSARTQRPPHRKSRSAEAGIGSAVPADKPRGNDTQPGLNDVAEIDAGSEESFKTSSSTLTITPFCTKGTKPGSPTKSSIGFLTS
ncbi:hypothetical protein GGF46_000766 [Coemansia sp. RSA 552]|nr:hypothetical protein GGF46_000766 [Coemansia sp. RSA 552]